MTISRASESMDVRTSNLVLLVIDPQRDFLDHDAPYRCINSGEILSNIREILQSAREAGMPIIFTREAHNPDGNDYGMEAQIGQPPHCVIGTKGFEIVSEISPAPNEIVINKRRYDAFLGTPLDMYLRKFDNPTLYVAGFTTNVCVHYTAISAFQYDYRVRVLKDCVSATSKEKHETGLRMLEFISHDLVSSKNKFLSEI